MSAPANCGEGSPSQAPMVADHLALDLLNTEARSTSGEAVDYWQTGEDVLRWLAQADLLPASASTPATVDQAELLSEAKALRTLARRLLVDLVETGESAEPTELNIYLHAYGSTPHLEHDADGQLVLTRRAYGISARSLLGAVAEAVAELLAASDPSLLKQCGHPECVLWFYDRSGRRRWCSMALCGNRQKVARFRKRAAAAGQPTFNKGAQS